MAKITANYETVALFSVANGEDAAKANAEKFTALIGENATLTKTEEWGKRRLAYPINDELEGHYIYYEFTSAPDFPAELDRIFKITDGVMRSLIIVKE